MSEQWLPVKGFEDYYEVSNIGRVRSLNRYVVCDVRGNERLEIGKMLRLGKRAGYPQVSLTKHNERATVRVHRLVYTAFVGDIPDDKGINHKNCVKDDNRIENLECITQKENIRHASRNGLMSTQVGEKNGSSKLTAPQVLEIRGRYRADETQLDLSIAYGVVPSLISAIVRRVIWKHI